MKLNMLHNIAVKVSSRTSGIQVLRVGAILFAALVMTACSTTANPPPATTQAIVAKGGVNSTNSPIRPDLSFDPTPTLVSSALVSQADAAQLVLINIYQRTAPSVVNIESTLKPNTNGDTEQSGSGFVLDTEGHIVTNYHVVQDAKDILVTFNDGSILTGTIVGTDDYSDIAVLSVDTPKDKLIPVTLGDSATLRVGQRVVTIGNPFGLLSSMTTGIVSATGRTLKSSAMLNPSNNNQFINPSIIQIDAQINPGSSGGPLLDINGTVIGINTAIRTETGVFQGVGFAVPINTVKRVVPQLIKTGKTDYSWLGIGSNDRVSFAMISNELKLPVSYGILIDEVKENSPAAIAGIRPGTEDKTIRGVHIRAGGDIIVAVNGQPVRDMDALLSYLVANTSPGDTITLTVIRGNETFDVKVILKSRPQ